MGKLFSTLVGVLLAVGGFSALWVGANLIFNQATQHFRLFNTVIGAVCGLLSMALLDGNQLLTGLVARPSSLLNGRDPGVFTDGFGVAIVGHLLWPVVGAVIGAGLGYLLAISDDRRTRLAASVGTGAGVGLLLSFSLRPHYELAMRSTPLLLWTVAFTLLGLVLVAARSRERDPVSFLKGGLTGAAIGWTVGAFGGALQGVPASNQTETTIAFLVAGALLGTRIGLTNRPDMSARAAIDDRSRAWLFVGPGVLFIAVMLVIPAIQTLLLSFQSDRSENIIDGYVGLENYRSVFDNPSNFDTANVSTLFTSASETSTSVLPWGGSALIPWVLFFLVVGGGLALLLGRETGQAASVSGAPMLAFVIAGGLFSFALFTHLRGTIINNLWWVLAVTLLSTSLGLAIAKLADGAQFESVAKSFVFMPMAISMVGASIIWRLMMYQARDVSKSQTGVFNALWVWLGQTTTSWASSGGIVVGLVLFALAVAAGVGGLVALERFDTGPLLVRFAVGLLGTLVATALLVASFRTMGGKLFIGGMFLLTALALAYSSFRSLASSVSASGLYLGLSIVPLWLAFRALGDGIGGFVVRDGEVRPLAVNFVQGVPYNNFWLMLILIWIQTGFAMVILSAAIKAVPGDFLEAAQIDGATDGQIFWRITVPQITPTIGVVATTIMVNVMKVFDIVKVTTNGQFGTQVLANAMFSESFVFSRTGIGASLAVLIFVGIFPVMVYNIYRLTKEA